MINRFVISFTIKKNRDHETTAQLVILNRYTSEFYNHVQAHIFRKSHS